MWLSWIALVIAGGLSYFGFSPVLPALTCALPQVSTVFLNIRIKSA